MQVRLDGPDHLRTLTLTLTHPQVVVNASEIRWCPDRVERKGTIAVTPCTTEAAGSGIPPPTTNSTTPVTVDVTTVVMLAHKKRLVVWEIRLSINTNSRLTANNASSASGNGNGSTGSLLLPVVELELQTMVCISVRLSVCWSVRLYLKCGGALPHVAWAAAAPCQPLRSRPLLPPPPHTPTHTPYTHT